MIRFALACELRKVMDGGAAAYVGALPDGTRIKVRPIEGGKKLVVFLEESAADNPNATVTRTSRDRHALSRERSRAFANPRDASPPVHRTVDDSRRRLTAAEIDAHGSPKGGWSRAGLAKLGVPWPPPRGWRKALLRGDQIPAQNAARREAIRDAKSLENKETGKANASDTLAGASTALASCYPGASGLLPVCSLETGHPSYVGPIRDRRTGDILVGAEAEASPLAFRDDLEAMAKGANAEPSLAVLMGERLG